MALRPAALRPAALLLRALGLGDLLTGVPALRAIRRALPGHDLVLAAPASLEPLAGLTGAVDLLAPTRGLARLDLAPPDVAVNLHGRGPESHQLLVRLAPRRLIGFRRAELGIDGPPWTAEEHEVRRWCRLVGATLGGDPDPGELQLAVPDVAPPVRGAVVIHPGAGYPARRWPPERYAAVAAALGDLGPVVVTGSAPERSLADRVRRLAGLPPSASLAGRLGLAELAALVAHARLVICGDTGVAHLATAYRAASVVLFGPTPPHLWGPPPDGPHVALWRGTSPGDPWADQPDPALLEITPDEVLDVVHDLSVAPRR